MIQIHRWQFNVDDFARMGEVGIFSEDDRVELIDGEVRIMSPIGARHAGIVNRLNAILSRRMAGTAIIGTQNPLQLSDFSEPQPDLAVLTYRDDYYTDRHPGPSDTLLILEVADSSLEYDRDEKLPRYAQAGIPEVWLIDVLHDIVTQYFHPAGSLYREIRAHQLGDVLTSNSLAGLEIAIDEIFGART